jgi:hypothetical protein
MFHIAWRRARLEKRRRDRLRQKAQKAGVADRLEEINQRPSWNKRFGAVQAARFERQHSR